MNNTIINKMLKSAIIIGLAIIAFIPLYIENSFFFLFITGKAFAFRILVEIIFAIWLILILREKGTSIIGTDRSIAPRINYISIAITCFTIIVLIADLLGFNPLRSIWSNFERMEGWITIIHLWAYFFVASSIFGNSSEKNSEGRKYWNIFLNVILFAGTLTAFYGLFQFFGLADVHQSASRVDASLGNSAYMAVYMIFMSFISIYLIFVSIKQKINKKDGSIALLSIYSLLFILFSFILFQTATRGSAFGWIGGIFIVCGIIAIFGGGMSSDNEEKKIYNILRYISICIISLIIIFGATVYINKDSSWVKGNEALNRLSSITLSSLKGEGRAFIWPMAVRNIFNNPKTIVIGVGQENFNYIFNKDYNPLMYGQEQWFDRAHSVFLDWLVASGLLGLIIYLSFYILSLVYIWKSNLDLGQKASLTGLIIAYGIHNVFVFDNQTSYVMFFTILAFISSITISKTYSWLGHSNKKVSEDGLVIRDYIYNPILIIVFILFIYFINIRNIQANRGLIIAMKSCSGSIPLSIKPYQDILKLNQTTANQEIREQLISCAGNIMNNNTVPQKLKLDFYNLTKSEIEKQISESPNDARIYSIGGSFFNNIGDFNTALPILDKAYELTPRKQAIAFELATNYMNTNRAQDAVDIAKKAYESAPGYSLAKMAYIVTLINANQENKARELFGDEKELFLDQRVIAIYAKQKKYSKIIPIYKELISKDPENPQLYMYLSVAYLSNKQTWLALEELKSIIKKFPETKDQIDPIIKDIESGKNPLQ